MSLLESLLVSAFGLSVVFAVLISLSFLVKVQSATAAFIVKNVKAVSKRGNRVTEAGSLVQNDEGLSTGELKLTGADEKTAAMIMAIVSHESQIPLPELQFKSIKAID